MSAAGGRALLGLVFFCFRFVAYGGKWVSSRPTATSITAGGSSVGRVLDRDGDVLSCVDDDGNRRYYESEIVRKATLHAVGDPSGNIGTGAPWWPLPTGSGYNLFTGAYTPLGTGTTST